jgi:HK97 family phage major capsid protein
MPAVATLNEELDQARAKRELLRQRHPGSTMPEDARAEDDSLIRRMGAITTLIEEEKQKERDAAFDNTAKYMDDPVYTINRAVNADDEGMSALHRAGWELNGGYWEKMTSLGKPQVMYPEEVLAGPLPNEPGAAHFVNQTRQIIQPEYRNAWLKWFKAAPQGNLALSRLTPAEQNALSEGTDGAGGFIVPADIQAEIGGRRAQVSVMRALATVKTTMRDTWKQPMIKPSTASGGRNIYADDFIAAWVGETPTQTSIDVAFEMFEISIKKLRAYTLLSNDLISDSIGNLVSELASRGGRSIALKEDEAYISGGATALEPTGILRHPLALTLTSSDGMAVDVEGSVANTISNSVSAAGSAPLIKALVYQLASQYTANASWLMRRVIQGDIAGLVDANGRPFWNSYLESGFARPQMQIEGFPVYNSEFVGNDGAVSTTPATIPLIFGDLSAYHIVERAQLSVRVLTERFGDTDQTGIFLFVRVGGGLWNYDAIRTGVIAA